MSRATEEKQATMRVASRLFGPLEVAADECYTMPDGMLGFAGEQRFVLLPATARGIFWFQSVDDGALIFLAIDPFEFHPEYEVDLPELPEHGDEHTIVLTIVTLPRHKGDECTTNLQAPLIFDLRDRTVRQVVVQDPRYHTRHGVDLKSRLG